MLALILFSVFPFSITKTYAQLADPREVGPRGDLGCIVSQAYITMDIKASRTVMTLDEEVEVQVVMAFRNDNQDAIIAAKACEKENKGRYGFQLLLYNSTSRGATQMNGEGLVMSQPTFFVPKDDNPNYGYAIRQKMTGRQIAQVQGNPDANSSIYAGQLYLYSYARNNDNQQTVRNTYGNPALIRFVTEAGREAPKELPPLPAGVGASTTPVDDSKEPKDVTQIKFNFKADGTSGLRDKYRVLRNDNTLVPSVWMDWGGDRSIQLKRGDTILAPAKNTNILNAIYDRLIVGFNYASVTIPNTGCESGWVTEDCSKVAFHDSDPNGKQSDPQNSLPSVFNPVINKAAWDKPEFIKNQNPELGQPMGTVQFQAIPILWAEKGGITGANPYSYVYGNSTPKFTVEIYNKEEDLIKACQNDGLAEDVCKDATKRRTEVGKVLEASTGTDQAADKGGNTLYSFIVRVISSIIVWLQSIIYRIFAFIVVPVLKALLKVRPYEDAFVNIIYPGWLILRNLANIFFIVALLWVGLKILFQQAASGAAYSFIRRLVIMALLVNFSLVVAQGVVAIADTVQAQFFPADSRVLEVLGAKLMVEPMKIFQASALPGDSGVFTSTNADLSLADTIKPIVLLVLTLASFISFLVLGAFLLVRLVALWILYMVSPIAYVGFVLDETRSSASQWWTEFIKYVTITPVLAFFLNIAALMATLFSGSNNSLFKFSDGSLSGDLVGTGLTVITHFVVLGVLYAGMIYASKSGVVGAKTITKYAQKGFEAVTTRPAKALGRGAAWGAKAGKDWAADSLATSAALKGKPGWQKAIRAAARPIEAGKALKKGYFDIPKERMDGRFASAFGGLTRTGVMYGDSKLLPAKMLYWKLTGQDAAAEMAKAELEGEARNVLTDDERAERLARISEIGGDTAERLNRLNNGKMSVDEAKKLRKQMASDISGKESGLQSIKEQLAEPGLTPIKKARLEADQRKAEEELRNLKEGQTDLDGAISSAVDDGTDVNYKEFRAKLKPYIKEDELREELEEKMGKVNAQIKPLQDELNEDTIRRKRLDIETFSKAEKDAEKEKYNSLIERAAARDWADSPSDRNDRAGREKKAGEAYADIDDKDVLIQAALQASKNQNYDLLGALSKQLMKAGHGDDMLAAFKEANNSKGLENFVEKMFKNLPKMARMNIGLQLSTIATQNGNNALGAAVQVTGANGRAWKTLEKQQADIRPLAGKRGIKDMGKGDYAHQDASGKWKMNKGVVEYLNSQTSDEAIKKIKRDIKPDRAKFILNDIDGAEKVLHKDVVNALKAAMGKGR